jgi:hypothetical protein
VRSGPRCSSATWTPTGAPRSSTTCARWSPGTASSSPSRAASRSYQVTGSQEAPKDEFPTELVYGHTPEPTLRLITCGGPFDRSSGHYEHNTIVFADLVPGP